MYKNNQPFCLTDQFGSKHYYLNNLLHREDGPALEYANGDKAWYFHGQLHRLDGPAIEYYNGNKVWYVNDIRHRLDGPAIEYADGDKEWWYHGKWIDCSSQEGFVRLLKLRMLW